MPRMKTGLALVVYKVILLYCLSNPLKGIFIFKIKIKLYS